MFGIGGANNPTTLPLASSTQLGNIQANQHPHGERALATFNMLRKIHKTPLATNATFSILLSKHIIGDSTGIVTESPVCHELSAFGKVLRMPIFPCAYNAGRGADIYAHCAQLGVALRQ